MSKKPRLYTAEEKAKIALEALKGQMTQSEITKKYNVHSTQINKWKKRLKEGVAVISFAACQKVGPLSLPMLPAVLP